MEKRFYVYDISYFDRIDSKVCKILIFLYFGKFTFFGLSIELLYPLPDFRLSKTYFLKYLE